MGWRRLAEMIREARVEKGLDVKSLSDATNISMGKLAKMERGDFSIDDPFYVKVYLQRIALVLDLDYDDMVENFVQDLMQRHEEVVKRDPTLLMKLIATLLLIFPILLWFQIEKVKNAPIAVIENTSGSPIFVNGSEVPQRGEYYIYERAVVESNGKGVLVRTFGGEEYVVKMKCFEVSVHGRGQGSGSR